MGDEVSESAFPIVQEAGRIHSAGLTKREWFAGMAMTAMGYTMTHYGKEDAELAKIADTAFRMADAMISRSK